MVPYAVTTTGDRSPLVTDAPNPICRNTPRKAGAQFRPTRFAQFECTSVAHLVNAGSHLPAGFHAPFTQCLHAHGKLETPVGANCLASVRSQISTIGTRPPMRTRTKFAPRFALLVRTPLREADANQSSGCQSLVSTLVSIKTQGF